MKSERKCVDCGASLAHKHGGTIRCIPCVKILRGKSNVTPQQACATIVTLAVKAGILPKQRSQLCVDCGDMARSYDHRDYMKPLEVEPVCVSCNNKRGPALNRDY